MNNDPAARLPRGIRNNNPGNLRRSRDRWEGLREVQTDPDFFQFKTTIDGLRALAKTLLTYRRKHGLKTVTGIVSRYAPAADKNNTRAYINDVANALDVGPDDEIDGEDRSVAQTLMRAIIRHENGQQPYSGVEIDAALGRSGYPFMDSIIEPSTPMPLGPVVLAPKQWTDFLDQYPDQDALPADMHLTPEKLTEISSVNRAVNATGWVEEAVDSWGLDLPGDCENMALAKRDRLAQMEFLRGAFRIADGYIDGKPHAALVLVTSNLGDYVLDNTTDLILPWRNSQFRARARAYRGRFWHRIVNLKGDPS